MFVDLNSLNNSCSKHLRLCKAGRFSNLPPSPNSTGCLNQAIYLDGCRQWIVVADFSKKPSGSLFWIRMQKLPSRGMILLKLQAWARWGSKHVRTRAPLACHAPQPHPLGHSFKALLSCIHLSPPTHTKYPKQANHLRTLGAVLTFQKCSPVSSSWRAPHLPTFFSFTPLPRTFSASSSPSFPSVSLPWPWKQPLLCLQSGSIPVREGETGCICGYLAASDDAHPPDERFFGLKKHRLWKDILQEARVTADQEELGF